MILMVQRFKTIYHYLLAFFGNIFYGFPSKKIFVLGVTGTKGKSTTLEALNYVFEATGNKTALLSSVRERIVGVESLNETDNTMPGRFFIQRFLKKAVQAGAQYAFIEITSEGIIQHRHRFIDWDGAVFLNLHKEHIERHGSFENYRGAKIQFFQDVATRSNKSKKWFFINNADEAREYFYRVVQGRGEVIQFDPKIAARIGGWLGYEFNRENAAAVLAIAISLGIPAQKTKALLNKFPGLTGRMETVREKPFKVVVDYAHTPDSLEAVYRALTKKNLQLKTNDSKLICVLGSAGGGRDKWKRSAMGKVADTYCREIILTNEDPYDENPEAILQNISFGFSPNRKFYKILDRRAAIERAIRLAKKGDTVIVTGKGSERWIHVKKGDKIPWDEKRITAEILKEEGQKKISLR